MAGQPLPRKGRKLSVYFSGEQLEELERRGLTPAEIVKRGFQHENPVELPADLHGAMEYVGLLAQALAQGGRVTYPDRTDPPR